MLWHSDVKIHHQILIKTNYEQFSHTYPEGIDRNVLSFRICQLLYNVVLISFKFNAKKVKLNSLLKMSMMSIYMTYTMTFAR